MASSPAKIISLEHKFDLALLSDLGTEREQNEDSSGSFIEGANSALFAVADGIGGYEGGEVASSMAIDLTLAAYRDSPAGWGPSKRLYRAVQRANISIHNKALSVPELRMMGTTLTVAVVEKGTLFAAHVGDCRLHLVRGGRITQVTRDHTIVAERVRFGLMSERDALDHPARSTLSRCVGHDLIVSVDRITMPLILGDRLILSSDGLHGVIDPQEMESLTRGMEAEAACRALIDSANRRGTADNLTCAIFKMLAPTGNKPAASWRERVRSFLPYAWNSKGSSSFGGEP